MQGNRRLHLAYWLTAPAVTFALSGAALAQPAGRPGGPAITPVRFQQVTPLSSLPAREISDQDHARSRMRSGENRSFEELLTAARRVGRGDFIAVEPDISTNVYRFKFMRPSGNMVWIDVDGRTAQVVAERE